jgi:hypothetical protein
MSHARSDTAGVVLRARERLEVVIVERFVELRQGGHAELVKELCVPAEARDTLCHSAAGTSRDSGDLAVGGAVDDASGDRDRELGALEVVAHRKRLLGEPATAGPADEPWDDPAVTTSLVGRAEPPVLERCWLDPVLAAITTRAERRHESIVRDGLDLGARPVHDRAIGQAVCRAPETESTPFLARVSVRDRPRCPPADKADGHFANHYEKGPADLAVDRPLRNLTQSVVLLTDRSS